MTDVADERPLFVEKRLAVPLWAKLWLALVILLAAAGAVFDVALLHFELEFQYQSVTAQGTVIGRHADGGSEDASGLLRYRFVVQVGPNQGNELVGEWNVSTSPQGALEEGMPVEVAYLPNNPCNSRVGSYPAWVALGVFLVVEFVLLAMLLVPVLAFVGPNVLRKVALLYWRGYRTRGTVTGRWVAGRKVCVVYLFDALTPDGQTRSLRKAELNRRAYRRVQVGDWVTVRYLPYNPPVCRLEGRGWRQAHSPDTEITGDTPAGSSS